MPSQKVPKKNISSILVDVKKPDYNYDHISRFDTVNLAHVPQAPRQRFSLVKKLIAGAFFLFGAALLLWGITIVSNISEIKFVFAKGTEDVMQNFSASVQALREFRPYDAAALLRNNEKELVAISETLKHSYGDVVLKMLGAVLPPFKKAGTVLEDIRLLNENFIQLTDELVALQSNGLKNFQGDGMRLVQTVSNIRTRINGMAGQIESIRNNFSEIKNISSYFDKYEATISEGYLKYSKQLHELDAFLASLVNLLGSQEERHILVLFQNTAEIRPGGGFVGSYADVAVKNGQLQSIDVRDIYDPDGQLDLKIVPPQEIKTMSTNWGARDANWFFDFPTSAKAILFFLENSKMYKEKNVTFDAVIGLNLNVFESVISVTGPIPIEEYKVIINEENFLSEIQREVETGEDKKAGEPKRILKILAPLVLERMNTLSDSQSRILVEKISGHFSDKDIMIYAKNNDIQNFVTSVGIDGGVYVLPNNFWGSYIGVVNANIAGGKTDVFMDQSIDARIDVDSNGNIFTDLGITRAHTGGSEKDAWWRATNKNFIQVYGTPGSSLVSIKGNDVKTLVSKFDYVAEGYATYPDLEKIEKTKIYLNAYQAWSMQAFGKSVFGTWFNVPVGKEKTLFVRYTTPATDKTYTTKGRSFTFVFETQSGVKTKIKATISAPLGYIWEESQSPFFTYENDDVSARTIVTLTLGK